MSDLYCWNGDSRLRECRGFDDILVTDPDQCHSQGIDPFTRAIALIIVLVVIISICCSICSVMFCIYSLCWRKSAAVIPGGEYADPHPTMAVASTRYIANATAEIDAPIPIFAPQIVVLNSNEEIDTGATYNAVPSASGVKESRAMAYAISATPISYPSNFTGTTVTGNYSQLR